MPANDLTGTAACLVEAPLKRRAASLVYEGLLLVGVLWCASLPVALFQAKFGIVPVRAVFQLYLAAAAGAYFVWHWARSGQTLAMKTWRLRLVSRSGTVMTIRQAVVRYIAALLGLALFGIGFLWALLDRDGTFLHDRLAGTRIVSSVTSASSSDGGDPYRRS